MEIKDIFENMNYGPAPESDKFALEWIEKHSKKFGLFINGEWRQPSVSYTHLTLPTTPYV